jgi:hypothetical protein
MNTLLFVESSRMSTDCSVIATDTVTFIVFLSDSKTTKIFSNVFDLTGSLKGLTVVGLVVETSAHPTEKTAVSRPKQML